MDTTNGCVVVYTLRIIVTESKVPKIIAKIKFQVCLNTGTTTTCKNQANFDKVSTNFDNHQLIEHNIILVLSVGRVDVE